MNIIQKKKEAVSLIATVIIILVIMAVVDYVITPSYFIKSIIKASLFLVLPTIYSIYHKDKLLLTVWRSDKKFILEAVGLGILLYAIAVAAYMLFGAFFDLSQIVPSLAENSGITGSNFIGVAFYISFINSLLEEFFFRAFAYFSLSQYISPRLANIFSAAAFSLYHVAMMIGWVHISLLLLAIMGLVLAGLVFNFLIERSKNIYASWVLHMAANFAINTIGLMLFGLI